MELKEFVKLNKNKLQKKDIQNITKHKIDYISDYVNSWGIIASNYQSCLQVNFIDCMCNAGIYNDTTLGTSMRVLKIFINLAQKHKTKVFNLFLNDYDKEKVEVIKELSKEINKDNIQNINIFYSVEDVNEYLESFNKKYNKYMYNSLSLLFVDPYNFGDVKIKNIKAFLQNNYSELLFNYFCSDYYRNINNPFAIVKHDEIIESMKDVPGFSSEMTYTDVLELIRNYLKVGENDLSFAYEFRTSKNAPFYHILYITRNKKGLVKIKDSYWKIFEGESFYLNDESSVKQESLIDIKDLNEEQHAQKVKIEVIKEYSGKKVDFNKIELFILENSMLRSGQIIKLVLNPLIENGQIIKCNETSSKRNYREDYYIVCGEKNEKL